MVHSGPGKPASRHIVTVLTVGDSGADQRPTIQHHCPSEHSQSVCQLCAIRTHWPRLIAEIHKPKHLRPPQSANRLVADAAGACSNNATEASTLP